MTDPASVLQELQEYGSFEVEEELTPLVTGLVTGRRIVGFEREKDSGEAWGHAENSVKITLDDGSVLEFYGWGHDASGLHTSYVPPPAVERPSTDL